MTPTTQFLEARAIERRNRLATHLGVASALEIPLLHSTRTFSVPQLLLTERMRLHLMLSENAFFTGRRPLLGDVFNLLWRMHPEFRAPLPGRVWALRDLGRRRFRFLRLWYAYGSLRTARLHRWLSRQVARCDLFQAQVRIIDRLDIADQDAPAAHYDGELPSQFLPEPCYFDDLVASFSETYHVPPERVLDLPRALIHQLYRNRLLGLPDAELHVIAPSDALLTPR